MQETHEEWRERLGSAKIKWFKASGICEGIEASMNRVSELAKNLFIASDDKTAILLRDMVNPALRQELSLARQARDKAQEKVAEIESERPEYPDREE